MNNRLCWVLCDGTIPDEYIGQDIFVIYNDGTTSVGTVMIYNDRIKGNIKILDTIEGVICEKDYNEIKAFCTIKNLADDMEESLESEKLQRELDEAKNKISNLQALLDVQKYETAKAQSLCMELKKDADKVSDLDLITEIRKKNEEIEDLEATLDWYKEILCHPSKVFERRNDFLMISNGVIQPNLNPKIVNIGDVVWYLQREKNGRMSIRYGLVYQHYADSIVLEKYDFPLRRIVNGVPEEKLETPTNWKKLPKNWTYSTQLVRVEEENQDCDASCYKRMQTSDCILQMITNGDLIPACKNNYCKFSAEITTDGWRIIREHDKLVCHFVTIEWNKCYLTYEEAQADMYRYEAELHRQAAMSDVDWSKEQIENTLHRYQDMYNVPQDRIDRMKDFLFAKERIEDLDIRLVSAGIQWKYTDEKRWKMMIEVGD